MQQQHSNPCSRCGKERIFVKTWKELVGTSMITYTITACPDKECQDAVDKEYEQKEERKRMFAARRPAFRGRPAARPVKAS